MVRPKVSTIPHIDTQSNGYLLDLSCATGQRQPWIHLVPFFQGFNKQPASIYVGP